MVWLGRVELPVSVTRTRRITVFLQPDGARRGDRTHRPYGPICKIGWTTRPETCMVPVEGIEPS